MLIGALKHWSVVKQKELTVPWFFLLAGLLYELMNFLICHVKRCMPAWRQDPQSGVARRKNLWSPLLVKNDSSLISCQFSKDLTVQGKSESGSRFTAWWTKIWKFWRPSIRVYIVLGCGDNTFIYFRMPGRQGLQCKPPQPTSTERPSKPLAHKSTYYFKGRIKI